MKTEFIQASIVGMRLFLDIKYKLCELLNPNLKNFFNFVQEINEVKINQIQYTHVNSILHCCWTELNFIDYFISSDIIAMFIFGLHLSVSNRLLSNFTAAFHVNSLRHTIPKYYALLLRVDCIWLHTCVPKIISNFKADIKIANQSCLFYLFEIALILCTSSNLWKYAYVRYRAYRNCINWTYSTQIYRNIARIL